uniref:Carboxylesterase type B domain-containing protein n=1 Tax=Anopheles albimanus TaxID=7167 RepID=A0A182FPJ5_ANOAL
MAHETWTVAFALLSILGVVMPGQAQDPSRPIISSPAGQIQGSTESCGLFCSYYSFKGIPYAQPPIGSLRFRNPVPHPGWSGVRDGANHGSVCLQTGVIPGQTRGSEDCLYLNIYTQQLVGAGRPVMVWIHGGGYGVNSGNIEEFGPEKLVKENVVLVTLNYRLGALGFLTRFYADRLASTLGFGTDSGTYVEQLRTVAAEQFIAYQEAGFTIPVPRFLRPLDFGPTVEPADAPEPRIITRRPIDGIRQNGHRVPFIIGYTDLEGAFFTAFENAIDPTVKPQFNANPHLLVPFFWNVPAGTAASQQISSSFQNYYWQGRPLDSSLDYEWTVYQTDHQFLFPMDQTVRLHAQASSVPLYYFQFAYDGDLNLYKKLFNILHPGAVHTDELPYLFHIPAVMLDPVPDTSHANTVSDRIVRMWANFARTGNPTPSPETLLQNIQWPSVEGPSGQRYLSIGHDLAPSTLSPNPSRMAQWYNLQQSYANAPFEV